MYPTPHIEKLATDLNIFSDMIMPYRQDAVLKGTKEIPSAPPVPKNKFPSTPEAGFIPLLFSFFLSGLH